VLTMVIQYNTVNVYTKTTPITINDKQPPLIDLSPVKAMVDEVVALVDPFLQEWFWNLNVIASLSIFGGYPGGILAALIMLLVASPVVFAGLWFITVPTLVLVIAYFVVLGITIAPMVAGSAVPV